MCPASCSRCDWRRLDPHTLSRRRPALSDLLGGQVQVYFTPMSAAVEYIRAGKLRALAVTTATRSAALAVFRR